MTNLKTLINSRFQLLTYMALSMMLSGFLLLLRVKLNQSFYYLFLVWNLFLAFIPFCMTLYLRSKTQITKTKVGTFLFNTFGYGNSVEEIHE
ncbi:hypothetical protein [Pontimicrobium aquaticum]|uniref:Uncharacterized protein n=1 Tax=Pontimicrobium aquaticum TaxID=2565367 RepID=A0A4U0EX70_9FLAO|nr:hypothetical protein [Pontimicrobium aquaticum]TJY36418.1 hypothetical protein E5167_07080 [Pontimicrobium aquaticum]